MERFLRDSSLIAAIVLLPPGLYCLNLGMNPRGPDTPLGLLAGAVLSAATFLSVCCAIRQHRVMRHYRRHL
jgi:hypothetical protein